MYATLVFQSSTFPSFTQPHVDFGVKLIGADLMSIPGLYGFVQVCLFVKTKMELKILGFYW